MIKWKCNICGNEFESLNDITFKDESQTHFLDHINNYIEVILNE